MKVGIAGAGGIGFASAAWLAHAGHTVCLWSPRAASADGLRAGPLRSSGVLDTQARVEVADSAQALCDFADVLLLAVPVNGHRAVMDQLLPYSRDPQVVIVSSMASLSALYLAEAARARGCGVTVASFGTTVLTARRDGPDQVRIMTRRPALGVSALPLARTQAMVALCTQLFGDGFSAHENVLASALTNINLAAYGLLALFNWTRI